jgi:anti-anti-sigma factor
MEVAVGGIHVNTTSAPGSTIIVHVCGDVDAQMDDELRHVVVDVIMRRQPGTVIIDLDHLTGLDSTTIGTLRAADTAAVDRDLTLFFRTSLSPLATQLDHNGIHDQRSSIDA